MDIFQFTNITDSISEAIIVVYERAHITLFNKAAEKLANISKEDAIGKPVEDVIPNTRLPIILKTGKAELQEMQQLKHTKIITNRMPIFDQEGRVIGAYAVFRD